MHKILLALMCALVGACPAIAQNGGSGQSTVYGSASIRSTVNGSVKITTGNTFQQILPSITTNAAAIRQSLTIQNNQTTTDNCFIIIGGNGQITSGTTTLSTNITIGGVTVTAEQASILLTPGLPYQRYWPYVPSDAIYGTCTTSSDSLYIDTQ